MSKLGYPCGGCGGAGQQTVISPKDGSTSKVDCPPCNGNGSGTIEVKEGATSPMANQVSLPKDYTTPKGK